MKKAISVALLLVFLVLPSLASFAAADDFNAKVAAISQLAVEAQKGVFIVEVKNGDKLVAFGSGWKFSDRLFVTDYHVVAVAAENNGILGALGLANYQVYLKSSWADKNEIPVSVLKTNEGYDLAVLSSEKPVDAPNLKLAEKEPQFFDRLFVIDKSRQLFSLGVAELKGIGDVSLFFGPFDNMKGLRYEMDVFIRPGYSGTPVFNEQGEIVGMSEFGSGDFLFAAITESEIKELLDSVQNPVQNQK